MISTAKRLFGLRMAHRVSSVRRIAAAVCLSCTLLILIKPAPVQARDEVIIGGATGSLEVELESKTWSTDEPILGKVIFQIKSVADQFGRAQDAVILNGPHVDVTLSTGMAATLQMVRFRSPLSKTIKVGHRYELHFAIKMDDVFRKQLEIPGKQYAMFNPGEFEISAMIASPAYAPWVEVKTGAFNGLTQRFNSKPVKVKIMPSSKAVRVTKRQVQAVIASADAALRIRAITFYARNKVLSESDLMSLIKQSQGAGKAQLASVWLAMGYSAKKLDFFKSGREALKFKSIDDGPVFVVLKPQDRLHIAFDVSKIHRFRGLNVNTVIHTTKKLNLTAPQAEGVYEMFDEAHKKHWGWVLVHNDVKSTISGKLRPNTREESAKVVKAILARSQSDLEAVAAPGFRAREVLKELRFKLGRGDVKYLESTGTSAKVKTKLRINMAPQGKPPVYARELLLEFTRFGGVLKLTSASVWDAQ